MKYIVFGPLRLNRSKTETGDAFAISVGRSVSHVLSVASESSLLWRLMSFVVRSRPGHIGGLEGWD